MLQGKSGTGVGALPRGGSRAQRPWTAAAQLALAWLAVVFVLWWLLLPAAPGTTASLRSAAPCPQVTVLTLGPNETAPPSTPIALAEAQKATRRPPAPPLPTDLGEGNFTVMVKTLNRAHSALRMIASVRHYFPNVPIVVGDDGPLNQSDAYASQPHTVYMKVDDDAGLASTRNQLLARVRTPYVWLMDDDFVIESGDLAHVFELLDRQQGGADMVGLTLSGSCYNGRGTVDNGLFEFKTFPSPPGPVCWQSDRVLNFFLARTSFLKDNPWEDDLKLGEHDFFFASLFMKARSSGVHCCRFAARHIQNVTADSTEYRFKRQRAWNYLLQAQNLFIDRFSVDYMNPSLHLVLNNHTCGHTYPRKDRPCVDYKIELIDIPLTGGLALEAAGARRNVTWGSCHARDRVGQRGFEHCTHASLNERADATFESFLHTPLKKGMRRPEGEPWHVPPRYLSGNLTSVPSSAGRLWFAVVRNPYERLLSLFYHPTHGLHNATSVRDPMVLNRWAQERLRDPLGNVMTIPQSHYVFAKPGGACVVHHLMRYEDLDNAFRRLMMQLHMPITMLNAPDAVVGHDGVTIDKLLDTQHFSPDTLRLINQVYADDFKSFRYPQMTGA